MDTPAWLRSILLSPATSLLGRVALTAAFWWSGVAKLTHFADAVAEVGELGLEPAGLIAALTIAVQLAGSVLIIVGRAAWLGAGALAVFTLLATLVAHAFWGVPAAERTHELNTFLEHLGLIGGFVLAAVSSVQRTGKKGETL
jgi:uncharacterized membrane protein YphA (DoxX/SURF4 family)